MQGASYVRLEAAVGGGVPQACSRAKGSHKGWGRKVVSSPHFPTRSLEKNKAECPHKGTRKGLPLPLTFPYQAVLTAFPGVKSRPTAQSPPRVPERRIQKSGPNRLPTPIPKALLALHYLHKKTQTRPHLPLPPGPFTIPLTTDLSHCLEFALVSNLQLCLFPLFLPLECHSSFTGGL